MDVQIEKIIKLEWDMFQEVENIGGRASCQDDFETFEIMRRSQYTNWTPKMRDCWLSFLSECRNNGRNLVMEKYARMMEYTDTAYYDRVLAPALPKVPRSNYLLVNKITDRLVLWEKDFSARYPNLAGKSRPVTADGDASGFTSMETYARGELLTYPTELLELYLAYTDELAADGKSLSVMIEDTMVKLYGYESIDDAEKRA